ncbi:GntG family PLP-dependent aldolase [Cryptosporangium japonicum]|uniref:GntG family PLP-dependent aldolase n=2 Tax=Cryptosporangium japonicum TaxID=80872 RepID=A0ABP3CZ56_9ACTN
MIDLRSDTVTRPTDGMRKAIAEAEVGDDVYGEDPTVTALETEVAELFGHEAALFVPSGTMANQLALTTLLHPGAELLCDADAHIVTYEGGAAGAIGGISTRTVVGPTPGALDVDAWLAQVRLPGYPGLPTTAVAVENTNMRGGGAVLPYDDLVRLRAGVPALHCDGARIWNASVASGVTFAQYGALFDTLSVCLSKGLGAPVGSLVVSTAERIARARARRHQLGGAMRQAGILAAAGRYALEHHVDRLADDHARAARLAEALGADAPPTNLVLLTVDDPAAVVTAAAEQGVLVSLFGPRTVRMITHLDVDDEGLDQAIRVLSSVLGG